MSRTDKDRPYWVRQNDDGTNTDHGHLKLGKTIYRTYYVYDENGKVVFHEEPQFYSASLIVQNVSGLTRYYTIYTFSEEAVNEARELVKKGKPYDQVQTGVRLVAQTEKVVAVVLKDYCTEGEKLTGGGYGHYDDLPCTPAMAPGDWGYCYSSFSSSGKKKRGYYDMRNGLSRRTSRDYLRGVVDSFNTYGEAFDDDDELPLTAQHRHSMLWDLY